MGHDVNLPYIWVVSPVDGLLHQVGFSFRISLLLEPMSNQRLLVNMWSHKSLPYRGLEIWLVDFEAASHTIRGTPWTRLVPIISFQADIGMIKVINIIRRYAGMSATRFNFTSFDVPK